LLKISPFGRNDKNGRYSKLSFQVAAENIPFEPDPDNAGVGSGGIYSFIKSHVLCRQKGMVFFILDDP